MKLKLRTWVKVVIVVILLVGMFKLFNNFMEDEINKCVEGGHSRSYCEYELSK